MSALSFGFISSTNSFTKYFNVSGLYLLSSVIKLLLNPEVGFIFPVLLNKSFLKLPLLFNSLFSIGLLFFLVPVFFLKKFINLLKIPVCSSGFSNLSISFAKSSLSSVLLLRDCFLYNKNGFFVDFNVKLSSFGNRLVFVIGSTSIFLS